MMHNGSPRSTHSANFDLDASNEETETILPIEFIVKDIRNYQANEVSVLDISPHPICALTSLLRPTEQMTRTHACAWENKTSHS